MNKWQRNENSGGENNYLKNNDQYINRKALAMSETLIRKLKIDPAVFLYPANRSRKKKPAVDKPDPIRIKAPMNKTLRHQPGAINMSKYILSKMRKEKETANANDKGATTENTTSTDNVTSTSKETFESEFEKARQKLEMMQLQWKKNAAKKPENYTLRSQEPKYGCLKNGNKPCFREWVKQHTYHQKEGRMLAQENVIDNEPMEEAESTESDLDDWLQQKMRLLKTKQKVEEKRNPSVPKVVNQKKTIRRTYHIGKSPNQRRVGILVSNKTIRNTIENKCNDIRQTPIEEVRRILIKKGFIKIGSVAPNDVLRKMYESVCLVAGDVTNHNGDNLVYNYFHAA